MKYDSKIGKILEEISHEIVKTETFKNTPIFYDFIEVDANNLPPQCIIYKPLEWRLDPSGCNLERQLDIILVSTTEESRDGIVAQLHKFGEKLKEVTDEYALKAPYLEFIQGSPIHGKAYNRESIDSYKETKQLFTSMIVLSYILRY